MVISSTLATLFFLWLIADVFTMFATFDIIKSIQEQGIRVKNLMIIFVLPGFLAGLIFWGLVFGIQWIAEKSFWDHPVFNRKMKG